MHFISSEHNGLQVCCHLTVCTIQRLINLRRFGQGIDNNATSQAGRVILPEFFCEQVP